MADAIRLAGVDGLSEAVLRADQARYQEVEVRSALNRAAGMPFDWALNPYRGCTHACEYCYARKYQKHMELDAGDAFSSVIFVKVNLPRVLAREVARPSWDHSTVAIGTATDPYQPIEGHYRLTRQSLEILRAAKTPVSIITKGPMIVRDIDLLAALAREAGATVHMSVPSVDEEAWQRLEPGTASPAQRLRAVRQLSDAGIDAGVNCAVLYWPVIDPLGRYEYAKKLKAAGGNYPPVVDRVLPDHDRYWQSEDAMSEGSPTRIMERSEKTALPPVLYLQGTADVAHPRPNLDRFVAAYRKAGGRLDLQLYEGEGEGFFIYRPDTQVAADACGKIVAFLHRELAPGKA